MKIAKIVLVAEWDGWCGACVAERPLVLTRTGRQRLVTWLTGAADDSRPLVLTCRLCGTGVDVPLERDDPPVASTVPDRAAERLTAEPGMVLQVEPVTAPPVAAPVQPAASVEKLTAGRQAVAAAFGRLLAQRSAAVPVLQATPSPPVPASLVKTPVVAPVVPVQRTPSSGGLAELQLLADGIDLLSTGRT